MFVKILGYLLALFLFILIFGLFCVLGWFLLQLPSIFSKSNTDMQVGIIGFIGVLMTVFCGFISLAITHYHSKTREIQARHFDKKLDGYKKIIELLPTASQRSSDEIIEIGKEIHKSLISWGSSNVINAWNNYIKKASRENTNILLEYEKILIEIRKDLGHDDTSLQDHGLLKIVIRPQDHDNIFS